MIPKKIHYCWFGRNKKSKLIKKCIKSWKKHCPDFEIIEWNEDNFDVSSCRYIKEAYENKMWAFVSDYARHDILYKNGGIYLDTDVEILRPLDEELLSTEFLGFELPKAVNSGLIYGAESGSELCRKMLDSYNNDRFVLEDGKLNKYTVCQRMTAILAECGLVLNDTCQTVGNVKIYDTSYFNPIGIYKDGKIQPNSYSVHHYNCSWHTPKERIADFLGPKVTKILIKILHFVKGKR